MKRLTLKHVQVDILKNVKNYLVLRIKVAL